MTFELAVRLIGMVIGTILGAKLGALITVQPFTPELFGLTFGLVGSITGLIVTPYLTTRPARSVRRLIATMPIERLGAAVLGVIIGLIIAGLAALPLSTLPQPFNQWVPTIVAVIAAYVTVTLFSARATDVGNLLNRALHPDLAKPNTSTVSETLILLDTSVIIDGRVLDISKTGFLPGTLLVPRFVLIELQHIADSSDVLKRSRGRRGLEILEGLQNESRVPVRVIDDDVEGIRTVDDKLVLLAQAMHAQLMTNDFNLNGIAKLQGVTILNVNELANAIKAAYLPGEHLSIRVIAEGREANQGVGYLIDGTMVVVEDGKKYVDRTLDVVVTRMIQTAAGKMYFARPGTA